MVVRLGMNDRESEFDSLHRQDKVSSKPMGGHPAYYIKGSEAISLDLKRP